METQKKLTIDSQNRLVITEAFKDASGKGRTEISSYYGKKSPKKILVEGTWSLTDEHDLKLQTRGLQSEVFGKSIILKGEIKRVKEDSLVFQVKESDTIAGVRTSRVELKGVWRADENNRITFKAAKGRGKHDILTFQGAWEVNDNHELVYKYRKAVLKTKVKEEKIIIFKGKWEFFKHYLVYSLSKGNRSFFTFKALLKTNSFPMSFGRLKYQIGIEVVRKNIRRSVKRDISIFGNWAVKKGLKAGFNVLYSGGKKKESEFFIEQTIRQGSRIIISVKDRDKRTMGLRVTFLKTVGDDLDCFIAFEKGSKEFEVRGGVRVRFYGLKLRYGGDTFPVVV